MPAPARAPLLALVLALAGTSRASRAPRGWNNFDAGPVDEAGLLVAAAWLRDNLLAFGYDTLCVDGGWNINGSSFTIDAFGRPYPRLDLFPSAADGRGFASFAAKIHGMGLKLGVWIHRGMDDTTYAANPPIWNSSFHAQDAGVTTNDCVWAPSFLGTNAPSPAATAWYRGLAQLYVDQQIDFAKMDCMYAGHEGSNNAELEAFSEAFSAVAPNVTISLSPGGGSSTENASWVAAGGGRRGTMYRVVTDFHDTEGEWALRNHLEVAGQFSGFSGLNATFFDLDLIPFSPAGRPCRYGAATQQLLFSLYCITRAPLILGTDIPVSDAAALALVTNRGALALNEFSANNRNVSVLATNTSAADGLWAWAAEPTDGSPGVYVALFNIAGADALISVAVPPGAGAPPLCAADVYTGERVAGAQFAEGEFSAPIANQASGLFRIAPCASFAFAARGRP